MSQEKQSLTSLFPGAKPIEPLPGQEKRDKSLEDARRTSRRRTLAIKIAKPVLIAGLTVSTLAGAKMLTEGPAPKDSTVSSSNFVPSPEQQDAVAHGQAGVEGNVVPADNVAPVAQQSTEQTILNNGPGGAQE
jgi:hypothetical protein